MDLDFGTLRSLLQEPPSKMLWRRLLDFFEETPATSGHLSGTFIPYARGHVERWPIELAEVVILDGADWRRSIRQPWFSLVRSLVFDCRDTGALELLHEVDARFERMSVFGLDRRRVLDFVRAGVCESVLHLDLSGNKLNDDEFSLWLEDYGAPALQILDLDDNALTMESVEALATSTLLSHLEVLSMARNRLGAAGVEAMEELLLEHLIDEYDLSENGLEGGRNEVEWREWTETTDLDEFARWSDWDREAVTWPKEDED